MKRQAPEILDFYDYEVVLQAAKRYGMDHMQALREFVTSQTHQLLSDEDCGLTSLGAPAIFDIWIAEKLTGDPRTSINIRGE